MSRTTRFGSSESALLRHETYATGLRRLIMTTAFLAVASGVSIAAAAWAVFSKPEPRYFATRMDGGIIPLTPLNQPILTSNEVTTFAARAVSSSLTLNFKNFREDLARAEPYFEKGEGWQNFLLALETSSMLRYIVNRRLVSTAVANGATIIDRGVDARGRYSWTVQVPVTITYESSNEVNRSNLLAEVVISRLPTTETADAVGISRIVVQAGRAETAVN
jgi:intracellular multiplication protein IcmL